MKLYVLVRVTYDWYRFQTNCGVFKTASGANDFAKKQPDKLPILYYNSNFHEETDDLEITHWCVQEFVCM